MTDKYLLFLNVSYSFSILRPLQDAIRDRGGTAAWFLHDLDSSHLEPGELLLHSVDEVKKFNPRAVFVPGNWVPDFFPGVKVQIFHGFGIEKKGHFDIRVFFDLYCTHGPMTTQPFETLARRHGFFKVLETGWPKVDSLFNYRPKEELKTSFGGDAPVILYAPTFSPSLTSADALEPTIRDLSRQDRYLWLIKFHPLMDQRIINAYRGMEGENLRFIDDADIIPYLHAADIMISDTSSVVAEFLLLDKPVITFKTRSPAPHMIDIRQTDELESVIESITKDPRINRQPAREFVNQMHPYRDGKSSERVLDATERFITDFQGNLSPKPLNLWRKIQVRKRMHYYRIR